jgi:hypothetical protein
MFGPPGTTPPGASRLPGMNGQPGSAHAYQPGVHGRRPPRRLRDRSGLVLAGLVLGLAGLAVSVFGITRQFLPRTFSPAERQQIMAWELGKRWRTWPAGRIFPSVVTYQLPGRAFGGTNGLSLVAHRVGIARQANCGSAAISAVTARALTRQRCLAVLRATYTDETQSMAVTVGIAVLPSEGAARHSKSSLAGVSDPGPLVRAVHFRRTDTAAFGGKSGQVPWERVTGPYLMLADAGYADGRPWRPAGNDFYVRTEMVSLARGIGQAVASRLGAPPPQPQCPGSPVC